MKCRNLVAISSEKTHEIECAVWSGEDVELIIGGGRLCESSEHESRTCTKIEKKIKKKRNDAQI